jgi:hypothetical protein
MPSAPTISQLKLVATAAYRLVPHVLVSACRSKQWTRPSSRLSVGGLVLRAVPHGGAHLLDNPHEDDDRGDPAAIGDAE